MAEPSGSDLGRWRCSERLELGPEGWAIRLDQGRQLGLATSEIEYALLEALQRPRPDRALQEVYVCHGVVGCEVALARLQQAGAIWSQPTFDALSSCAQVGHGGKARLVGLPFDWTAPRDGSAGGAAAIRQALQALVGGDVHRTWLHPSGRQFSLNSVLADVGDVGTGPAPDRHMLALALSAHAQADPEAPWIVLGGDHSIAYSTIVAFAPQDYVLAVFDAHDDCSQTAELNHGSWLAHLLRDRPPAHTLLIGSRGLRDPDADAFLRRNQVAIVPAGDTSDARLREIAAPIAGRDLLLSIDLDVLDPAVLPHTGCPRPDGLSFARLEDWCEKLVRAASRVISVDVSELAADQPGSGRSGLLAAQLVLDLVLAMTVSAPQPIGAAISGSAAPT